MTVWGLFGRQDLVLVQMLSEVAKWQGRKEDDVPDVCHRSILLPGCVPSVLSLALAFEHKILFLGAEVNALFPLLAFALWQTIATVLVGGMEG